MCSPLCNTPPTDELAWGAAHMGVAVPPCGLQTWPWCPGCCCQVNASLSFLPAACDGDTLSHWQRCKGPLPKGLGLLSTHRLWLGSPKAGALEVKDGSQPYSLAPVAPLELLLFPGMDPQPFPGRRLRQL